MTTIISRIRKRDGALVRVHSDGREELSKKRPVRPMTEDEIHAAALSDPDARPLTPEQARAMKRTPQVRVIRRALQLSQEEFAARFRIPLGTLRDWEQGRKDPDAAARAYLTVIGRNPTAVAKALRPASA
jgi:putative transcriptional regulator